MGGSNKTESSSQASNNRKANTIKNWFFIKDDSSDQYGLFFSVLDEDDRYLTVSGKVDISIVNEHGEEVFSGTKRFLGSDFSYFTILGKKLFLAGIPILSSEIAKGYTPSGIVYFKVGCDDGARFDVVSCNAANCLPVYESDLKAVGLPAEVRIINFSGKVDSKFRINDVSTTFNSQYMRSAIITISGEKTYGSSASLDHLIYKIYDCEGYVVYSGTIYLSRSNLSKGDKFKVDETVYYDFEYGKNYTIQFFDYRMQ